MLRDPEESDIWIHDLTRGTETRFTTDPAVEQAPLWTPDGTRLVFSSDRDGPLSLFWKPIDTPGDAELLMSGTAGVTQLEAATWSADGQTLLFWEAPPQALADVGLVSLEGEADIGARPRNRIHGSRPSHLS